MPSFSDPPRGWFQRSEQRLADRMARRQLASVTARAQISSRPPWTSRLLMGLVVLPVYVVLVAILAGGLYLVVRGTLAAKLIGVLLLLLSYATRPRPAKMPRYSVSLTREGAPCLFAVLDEVAAVVRTTAPRQVLVTRDFNAFATRIGWRRRRLLAIGAPLWVVLSPQARVGLVGHELGHFAHGDLTDSWWVGTAQTTLWRWHDICVGPPHVYTLSTLLVKYGLKPFAALIEVYLWVISRLNGPANQRREYLADVDAARAAGTPGAVRLLETLFLDAAVRAAMTRAAVSPVRPDMWDLVRGDVSELDDSAFRERRRAAGAERNRIDHDHPTTVLRLELLETLPSMPAEVVVDAGRAQALDAELTGAMATAAAHAGDAIRYRR